MGEFKKVKHFTHFDLDGVGCAVLTKAAFGDEVDTEFLDANKSSDYINEWIDQENYQFYQYIMITDLSVKPEVANKLEKLNRGLVLLDHHQTAMELNAYSWCKVIDTSEWCGTNLLYDYLINNFNESVQSRVSKLKDFVEIVHRYDNWLWKELNDERPNQLNSLLKIIGKERFIDRFINDSSIEFSESEKVLLILEQERIDKYVWSHMQAYQEVIIKNDNEHIRTGVVFGDQYINELATKILDDHLDVELVIVIGLPNFLSFRSRQGGYDVTKIATKLKGGGHQPSGGAPLDSNTRFDLIRYLFSKTDIMVKSIN